MKELSLEMKERIVEEILNEFRQGNAINGTFLIKKIFAITNNDLGEDVEKIIGMLEDSLDNSIYYIMETYSEQLLTPGEYEAVNELQDFIDAVNYVKIAYDLILTSKDCMELKKMEKDFLELEKECKKDPDNQEKYELLQRQRSEKIKKENDIVGTLLGIPISFIKKFPGFGTYAACTLEGGLLCLDKGTELLIRHREQLEDSLRDILKGTGIIISLDAESSREIFRQRDIFNFISRSKLSKENKRMQESQEKFKKAWDDMKKVAGKVGEKIKDIVKGTEGKINDNGVEKIKDAQGDVTRPYDPLVVDLNHNGFDLHSVENGVYFDLDNNGTKEKTSWVDKQDGFLVMDQNGNGKIDTGAELFGEKVLLKNGQYSDGAIDVLSEFDENGDGIIDDKDSVFDKLMIWQDLNHNGISEEGELKTLKEHHIVGLKLTDIQSHQRNIAGSTLRKSMTYIYEETVTNEKGEEIKSQKEGTIGEFLLAKDNIDTHDTEQGQDMLSQLDLSKEDEAALYHTVKNLPDIRSFGRFKRLHNAMVLDKSGVLVGLVQQFQNSKNSAERENLLEQILLFMADATDVDASTKGQYANAKHIKVLEHVFDNPLREGVLDKRLGQTYEDAYHDIKSVYYTTLSMQTSLKDMQEFFLSKENKLINIALLNKYLELQLLQDKENSEFLFEETTKVLMYLDSLGIEGFEQFKHHFGSLSTRYFHKFAELNVKQYRENTDNTTTYLYTKGVTIHAGDGNNIIQGTFNGPSGNDYIYAGKGNDMIYGGTGSDTYFFEKGDGNDTIKESINAKDTNIVVFGKGIKKENLQIRRLNHHDVKITIKGTDDSLTIQGQIQNNEKGAIDEFFFFDGERMTYKELKESANQITTGDDFIETTNDNDEIDLLSGDDTVYTKSGKDTIHGNAGADTIYAGEGDDILYGDEGSDKLYGENGEDTLIGGTGDDYLNGGYGADTYLFHKGDGIDTIEEYDYNTQNIDKIQLDKDIKKEDIILNRKGNDLEITFKAGNDKIIVKNQFANANSTIEQIVYGNNQIIAFQEMLDTTNQNSIKEHLLQGAYTDDILVGSQESDTIHGYDGQDQITGGKGDDILDGGYGNDTYYYNKGDGSDIITDYSGNNTLILGEGISKDKVVFTRVSREDIVMSIVGTEDKITIKNQWNNRTIDKVQFHDGSSLTYDQIKSIVNTPTDRDDYLEGTNGADILEGGKGNDHLNGGYGGDTYVFSRGDGQDTIEDYSGGYEGVDKLIFKDINREDVIFSRESEKDITILVKNSNDKIKIKYGNNPYHAIEEIHFANGEVMTYEEMMKQPFEYYGDEKDNTINTYSTDDKIFAGAGNDRIHAGDGNNIVYGGEGNDEIRSGRGNDTLVGGKGNDYLQGYYGADTYIFSRGDGQDIVDENNSDNSHSVVDKIVFTDINREDVIFTKENNSDVTIKVKGSEDKVTIKNAHSNDWQIEEIHFANGEVMTYEEMMKQPFEYYGDEKDNTINTYSTDDKIFAGAGNDRIHAGDGNNIVYGGEGNDEIRSGRGNDTLVGGKGNDYLQGYYGADTYIFSRGDGQDIVDENNSDNSHSVVDKIVFTDINREDVIFTKENNSDVTIKVKGSEDSVTVKNWYSSDSYKIEEFHGEEKSMITSRQIDLLIQAMASFSQEKGISWSKAIEERPTEVEAVVQNFWAKQM